MTTDTIAAAIDHIRSITPPDAPWEPEEFRAPGYVATPSDHAIATILNAVSEGKLINRASRDEMLAQVRRGEGFATAGAEASWISDSEAGVYDTDAPDPIAAARAMIEPLTGYTPGPWWTSGKYSGREMGCSIIAANPSAGPAPGNPTRGQVAFATAILNTDARRCEGDARLIAAAPDLRDMVATLADALEAERAKVAAARAEGWRAGRDAAAIAARGDGESEWFNPVQAIRALPEPKEASYD